MTNAAGGQDQAHILFRVADTHWAVPVTAVQRVHDHLNIQPVAGTRHWFLGLAQIDGQLVPITDLSAWLDSPPATGAVLQLHPDTSLCGLRVDEVIGAQNDTPQPWRDVDGEGATLPGASLRSINYLDVHYRVLDVMTLLQSPSFIAIREVSPA